MTRMRGATRLTAAAAVGLLALSGCTGAGESPATPRVAPAQTAVPSAAASMLPVEPTDVLTGLSAPWSVVVLSDGSDVYLLGRWPRKVLPYKEGAAI